MADHASAKKRIRQTHKRTVRNRHQRATVRTSIKDVRAAIAAGDASSAKAALPKAVRGIDMAVSKGLYHPKTGARYISRLTQQVNSL